MKIHSVRQDRCHAGGREGEEEVTWLLPSGGGGERDTEHASPPALEPEVSQQESLPSPCPGPQHSARKR